MTLGMFNVVPCLIVLFVVIVLFFGMIIFFKKVGYFSTKEAIIATTVFFVLAIGCGIIYTSFITIH